MNDPSGGESPLSRRRTALLWIACGTAVLSLAGLVLSTMIKSPAQLAAETSAPERTDLTATVEERVLRETVVLRGTVVQAQALESTPTSVFEADKLVVTGARAKPGDWVKEGQVVGEVSGRPVILLRGAFPAYRDIRPGSTGKDVTQLQKALRSLGYTVDDESTMGGSTKAALRKLYNSLGYPVPDTGAADNEAVAQARARVKDAKRILAQARGATPPAPAAITAAAEGVDQAEDALEELVAKTGTMLPLGEVIFVASFPARVSQINRTVGREVQAPYLRLAVGKVIVSGEVTGADPRGIEAGQPAELTIGTESFPSKVTAVAEKAPAQATEEGTSGDLGTPGFTVTVTPDKALQTELIGEDARMTVVVRNSQDPVLVVPVAAVSAGADSATHVTVVGADGQQRIVAVTVDDSGDGYVAVSSDELHAGDAVLVGVP
ncbi:peptidoglycan hydrolase-like protein with peptidoglycan-binding domain [Actinoplanes tereljensis]|uniref:Peptidoglycan binding protein n=1 Tax=Paractinoplanes tereljensis TaxID=571912 RepID=A0A919NP09_9ACTN|nr:hypothetical protein [Actinoplanes tereljensis]GIF21688.1 hypothetical protein Ate02nite_44180 [Actinoplanes tereljensis]